MKMKFTIEQADIDNVKHLLEKHYKVVLDDKQTKKLISSDSDLIIELYRCKSSLDTYGRDMLSEALTNDVLDKEMEWPVNSSSDEYKEKFYQVFKEKAIGKGYKVKF